MTIPGYPNFEIIILDNQSVKPETLRFFSDISKDSRVVVKTYNKPFNFSAINNFGVYHANGEIVGLINNDVEVINGTWLSEMVSHALRHDIGCVGAKLYYENDTIQHAGVILGIGGIAGHSHKYFPADAAGYFGRLQLTQNYSAVTAAALVVRKAVFLEVGGLRESLSVAFNDVDFCLKVMKAGYRNVWTPYAELYHYESISRGSDESGEKLKRFENEHRQMRKYWREALEHDHFYSPHLSATREDFSIKD